jgi:hypothetical protein
MEDDVVISPVAAAELTHALARGAFDGLDIIFTDTIVPPDLTTIQKLEKAYSQIDRARTTPFTRIVDLSGGGLAGMSSYLVHPGSTNKVVSSLDAAFSRGPAAPIDLVLRQLAERGALKIGCVFPFLTTVAFVPSTISQHGASDAARVVDVLRYCFYVDADIGGVARQMLESYSARQREESAPERHAFLTRIAGLLLSEHYRPL